MTRILCWLATFGLVFQAMAAVTPGGGGGGGGGPTNGITGAQATNIVTALMTNKVDNLNGRSTNQFATNIAVHGNVGMTNTTLKFHEPITNGNIAAWYSLGDNGGTTRSWQQVVGTNRWYIQNGSGVTAIPFQLHGNGLGNVTLGHNTSSTTTNAGDLRVLGVAYDANGNAYSTNTGGGSQTPWAQNINGDGYSLTNAGNVLGGGLLVMDLVQLYPDSNEIGLAISPLTGAGNAVEVKDTNSAAALYVTPDGKVGVRTNAPDAALSVSGNMRQAGSISNTAVYSTSVHENNGMKARNVSVGYFSADTVDFAGAGGAVLWTDTRMYRHGANTNGFGYNSTPTGSIIASNFIHAGSAIFQGIASGPAGITNGLSAFWNSNGVATYLRSGPTGYTTNKDTVIAVH